MRGFSVRRIWEHRFVSETNHGTRESVAELLAQGMSQTMIAFELGLSKGTVCYHVRQIGLERDSRFARRYDWDEIQRTYDSGLSREGCEQKFGCSRAAWYEAVKRGALIVRPNKLSMEKLLVAGKPRNRGHIRARLVKEGLKEERCEECGLTEWRGKPLRVTLHHVNGDPYDHRLENLQFLCPNCHSQTPNFGGRNGHLRARRDNAQPEGRGEPENVRAGSLEPGMRAIPDPKPPDRAWDRAERVAPSSTSITARYRGW